MNTTTTTLPPDGLQEAVDILHDPLSTLLVLVGLVLTFALIYGLQCLWAKVWHGDWQAW